MMKRLLVFSSALVLTSCSHLPLEEAERAELLKNLKTLCIASDYHYSDYSHSYDRGREWNEILNPSYISEEGRDILESSGKNLRVQGLRSEDRDAFFENHSANQDSFSRVPEIEECDGTLLIYCQGEARCGRYFVEGLGPGVEHCPVAEMNIITMISIDGKPVVGNRIKNRVVVPPGFAFRVDASEVVKQPPLKQAFETSEFRDLMKRYAEIIGTPPSPPTR